MNKLSDLSLQALNILVAKRLYPGKISRPELDGIGVIVDDGYYNWIECNGDAHELLDHVSVSPPGFNGSPQYRAVGVNNAGDPREVYSDKLNIALCECFVEIGK